MIAFLCAMCLQQNQATVPAVTLVRGTAVCANHVNHVSR